MALKTRWQFFASLLAIVGSTMLLMAGGGSPKYVGRFFGDGAGLTNLFGIGQVVESPPGWSFPVNVTIWDYAGDYVPSISAKNFTDTPRGTTYFIDPSGNNGNDGLTIGNPKLSIAGVTAAASGSFKIYIAPGVYTTNQTLINYDATLICTNGTAAIGAIISSGKSIHLENLILNSGAVTNPVIWVCAGTSNIFSAYCCMFTNSSGNAINITADSGLSVFENCTAAYNVADGFNYKQLSGPTVFSMIEIHCNAYANGTTSSTIDNGTTLHDGVKGIRCNGQYYHNGNRNVHDIGTGGSWNLGCVAGASIVAGATSDVGFAVGAGVDQTTMYLTDCGTIGSSVYSLVYVAPGLIYSYNPMAPTVGWFEKFNTLTATNSLTVLNSTTNATKNIYRSLLDSPDGSIIRESTYVWTGAWSAHRGYGVGDDVMLNNTGSSANGLGYSALANNTGTAANGFGHSALRFNTGTSASGFGHESLYNNTGASAAAFGHSSMRNNTGTTSGGFGNYSLYNNTGGYASGVGYEALYDNVGSFANGLGYQVMKYNNWPSVVSMGHQANYFPTNTASPVAIYPTNFFTSGISVTHGAGSSGKVNLLFSATAGTPPTGLVSGTIYQFTITNATTLGLSGIISNASVDFVGKLENSINISGSFAIGPNANNTAAYQAMLGGPTITQTVMRGTVIVSNIVYSNPRWTDALATGFAIKLGANAPTLDQSNPDDAEIQSYFYGYGDDARFEVQSVHSLARTNATFPNFYFEPHLHCMTSTTASGTNATFRLKMDVAFINGSYTNVAVYSRTNTVTLTNAYSHYVLSFGNITNNLLQGHNSVLFRGFFERLNGGDGDIGVGTLVSVDSIDIHVPLDQIGSAQ